MNKPAPHPWTRFDGMFEKGYMTSLRRELNIVVSSERLERILNTITVETGDAFAENVERITDKQSQGHTLMTSYVLASYRVMQRELSDDKSLKQIIEKAFREPGRAWIQWAMRFSLFFTRDPMKMIVAQAGRKADEVYGESFIIECEGDKNSFYSSNVKRCGYHEFFKANGTPELTALLCGWDNNWTDEIKPHRHGIEFTRPTTIATGDDMCRFQFRRVSKR